MENEEVSAEAIDAARMWLRGYDWGPWVIGMLARGAPAEWLRTVSGLHRTLDGVLPEWAPAGALSMPNASRIAGADTAEAAVDPMRLSGELDGAITWLRQRGWGELMVHSLPLLGQEEWLRLFHLLRRHVDPASELPIQGAGDDESGLNA